ncbi:hypothetical protein [Frankia sp. CiP3]|uniref:hypothetical protein n=1 Tax=Frankia sp. CiP3 TaxID=2880971 RepID=UPI001EF5742F|nr:hypothetical protein [Frankia sp. CiP3]
MSSANQPSAFADSSRAASSKYQLSSGVPVSGWVSMWVRSHAPTRHSAVIFAMRAWTAASSG